MAILPPVGINPVTNIAQAVRPDFASQISGAAGANAATSAANAQEMTNLIGGAANATAITPTTSVGSGSNVTLAPPPTKARGVDFGRAVTSALENLQSQHAYTDRLAQKAATGDLAAVEDYMVAATETQLATQLTVAVRNAALEAFNDIMRMQI